MKNKTHLLVLAALPLSWLCAGEPILIPSKIDGPKHDPASHSYWFGPFSECCSVADFNGDGKVDLAAGRNWYEAPGWYEAPPDRVKGPWKFR